MVAPEQCTEEPPWPAVSSCEEPIAQTVTSQVPSYQRGMVKAIQKRQCACQGGASKRHVRMPCAHLELSASQTRGHRQTPHHHREVTGAGWHWQWVLTKAFKVSLTCRSIMAQGK